jgi:hypothetical protein
VQQIHRRLGIEAPLFTSAWMVNGIKFEVVGQQARRGNPPHGMGYRPPGTPTNPIPQGIIRDIPNTFYRPGLINLLPVKVLQVVAGFMWISDDTPGYQQRVIDDSKGTLILYYLLSLGSVEPYILLPTTVLIQLGRGAYASARMEIMDDVINMTRLRGRADQGQLASIKIMTVADPDGTGTPISAWAGRGSFGGQGTGGHTGASATGDRGGRYNTPGGQTTTSSYDSQYPVFHGMGSTMATPTSHTTRSGANYSSNTNNSNPSPLTPQMPMAGTDLGAIQAQLAQALSAIQTLTQQNQEMEIRLREMQRQRAQESRQEEQAKASGDQMESSPPQTATGTS